MLVEHNIMELHILEKNHSLEKQVKRLMLSRFVRLSLIEKWLCKIMVSRVVISLRLHLRVFLMEMNYEDKESCNPINFQEERGVWRKGKQV